MIVIGSTNFAIACAAFIAANYAIFVVTFYEVVRGFLFWINIVFAAAGWVCIVFGCRGVRFNNAMAIAGVEDAGDANYVWLSVVILGAVTKVLGYLGFAAAWYEHRAAVRAYGGAMAILLALWIVSCALVIVVIVDSNQLVDDHRTTLLQLGDARGDAPRVRQVPRRGARLVSPRARVGRERTLVGRVLLHLVRR